MRKFGVEILTSKDRIEPGKPMPEFGTWRGTRILYCTEPNQDEKLHTGVLKDITGGEIIQFRNLFSNEIQKFRPQFKVHLMCNDTPTVDGSDSGVKRRIRKIDYISRFGDPCDEDVGNFIFARDDALIQAFQERVDVKLAFFHDLVKEFSHGYIFEMPDSIRSNSLLFLEENDYVLAFVRACIVKAPGSCFTLKEARSLFIACGHPLTRISKLKLDLQKALAAKCHSQKRVQSRANNNICNVFLDYRLEEPSEETVQLVSDYAIDDSDDVTDSSDEVIL